MVGLNWADLFNAYVVWLMTPYLTDVWKLNFTPAAAIVNLWRGLMATLPFCMLFLADTVMGKFWMLSMSSLACSAGMGLLSMSIPSVFAKETGGTCTSYEPTCISDEKRILFFTAFPLVAFGISGLRSSLVPFLKKHDKEMEGEDKEISGGEAIGLCFGLFAVSLIPSAAFLSLSYINPWTIKFGLPAICTTAATLVFLTGSCHYNREPPKGSPFTTVFRVIHAAASKMCTRTPKDARRPYEKPAAKADDDILFLDHTDDLSFLDKAAIILPNQPLEQQKNNRWRLCRVTEVEETKIVSRLIPMSNHLNRKKYPLLVLPYICEVWKSNYSSFYLNCGGKPSKYRPPIGIAVSMVFAILCCITAAKVEVRRLDVVKSHGLLDKPDDEIPINFFWLLPQFALLGALDGIFEQSVVGFFTNQVPPSMTPYMNWLSEGIRGVGIMISVISVFVVGKISEKGGTKPSWFKDTLNKSRLDNYYWTLAFMVLVNLVFYSLVAFRFKYRDSLEPANKSESPDFSETLQELAFQDPENLLD
ncbi:protein NRT1/ PTR FAMILY 5.5 [Durio zibethinus]|uniref:Protein NRT1/ PTR FAMILY 5.5 n=1 Tax=Durio zibethinus TaxID=66656 RepID=A0A6P6ALX6_DURZI|nr:protein NRT1/ PTR FAMILY 5.5 [Durio zibethinus]